MLKSFSLKSFFLTGAFLASLGQQLTMALPLENIPIKPHEGVIPADSIVVNTRLTADKIWVLNGFTVVKAGVTLTIDPGTLIQPTASQKSTLMVDRGGYLVAIGTKDQPITFQCAPNADGTPAERGLWGGIVIMGKSKNNISPSNNYEGLGWARYGGNVLDDSSGNLTYVRLDGPGFPIDPDKELNGITLCSVGSKTVISHVQVNRGDDDAFEWFGGTVNADHLVATNQTDDNFDVDLGYSGNVDYMIGIQRNEPKRPREGGTLDAEPVGDFLIECSSSQSQNTPMSNYHFSHLTLIDNGGYDGAMEIKEQCAGTYDKMVVIAGGTHPDSASGWAFRITGDLAAKNIKDGKLIYRDAFLTGNWKSLYTFTGFTGDTNSANIQKATVTAIMNTEVKNYPYSTTKSYGLNKDLTPSNPDIITAKAGAIVDGDLWYKDWTFPGTLDFPLGDNLVIPNAASPVVTLVRTAATLIAPANFTLNSTATDADGIASIQILEGSTVLASGSTGTLDLDIVGKPAGTYTFTVKATDKHSTDPKTSTFDLVVIVNAPNIAPTVTLTRTGGDLVEPANFILNATAEDPDGINTLEILLGSVQVNSVLNAGTLAANVSGLPAGTYTYTVKASDKNSIDSKTSTYDLVVVVAPKPNIAPIVTLERGNDTLFAPANYTLKATATDPDGIANLEILLGEVVLGSSSTGSLTFPVIGKSAGTYTYTVRATDLNANPLSTTKDLIVIVAPTPNTAPTVTLTRDGGTLYETSTFTLTATAADADGINSLEILLNGAVLASGSTGTLTLPVSGKPAGPRYVYTVRATDTHPTDPKTTIDSLVVLIAPPIATPNTPPTVTLTRDGTTLFAPAGFTLTASAEDAHGIGSLQILLNGVVLGTDTTGSGSLKLSVANLPSNSYTYTVRATDKHPSDPKSAEGELKVDVAPTPNTAPVLTLTSSIDTLVSPASFTLNAIAVDPDGIDTLEILKGDVVIGRTTTTGTLSVPVSNLGAGKFSYSVRAKDKHPTDSKISTKVLELVVNPAPNIGPTVSLVRVGSGLVEPATFVLNATAEDPDGISALQILQDGKVIGSSLTGTLSITIAGLKEGSYNFSVKALDNNPIEIKSTTKSLAIQILPGPVVAIKVPLRDLTGITSVSAGRQALVLDSKGYGRISLTLWDLAGHRIDTRTVNIKEGKNFLSMGNIHGVHFLRISDGRSSRSMRVVFNGKN